MVSGGQFHETPGGSTGIPKRQIEPKLPKKLLENLALDLTVPIHVLLLCRERFDGQR
jgi:hypothetical protein